MHTNIKRLCTILLTSLFLAGIPLMMLASPAVCADNRDISRYSTEPVGAGTNSPWVSYYKDPRDNRSPEYHNVTIGPDGDVIAVGTNGDNVGSEPGEMIVGRYGQDGKMRSGWPKMFAESGMRWNEAQDVFIEPDGNITVCGYMITTGNVWNLVIWRLGPDGKMLAGWPKYMAVDSHSYGTAAIIDSNNEIVACGYSLYPDGSDWGNRLLLIKYRKDGTVVSGWPKTYQVAANQSTLGFDIIEDSDRNLVVAGLTQATATNRDAVLYKLDSNGNVKSGWPRIWSSGPNNDAFSSISQDANGDYCPVGLCEGAHISDDPPEETGKLLAARYSKDGDLSPGWPRRSDAMGLLGYHPPDVWHGYVDYAGNIAAAFTRQSDTSVNTLRYNRQGAMSEGFPQILNRNGYRDETHSCCVDKQGNIYVVGFSMSDTNPDGDYTTFVAKYTPAPYTWYLAEGSTGTNEFGSFETWILVQNPGDTPAEVQLFYQTPKGEVEGHKITVGAHSRETRNVAEFVPNEFSVSTRVVSDQPVIAERAMYWHSITGTYRQAATDSIGVTAPSATWYLAEGSTGTSERGSFETWILVQNPGDTPAEVKLYYQTPKGEVEGHKITVGAHSRETRNVSEFVPNEFSVSTRVESNQPVIAERAMYWHSITGTYRQAATDSIGVINPYISWYLAEGSTGTSERGSFETWILVQNPGAQAASVQLYYQTPRGEIEGHKITVGAFSRETRNVADFLPNEFSVSTRVVSDQPVIAERAMYWNSAGGTYRESATDSIGVTSPCTAWYLAEGSTGTDARGSFETWILVQNPGDTPASVQLYYQTPRGEIEGHRMTVGAHSRETRNVAEFVPSEFSVSTRVASDQPVIAERAMYWNTVWGVYRQAATDSIGFDP